MWLAGWVDLGREGMSPSSGGGKARQEGVVRGLWQL